MMGFSFQEKYQTGIAHKLHDSYKMGFSRGSFQRSIPLDDDDNGGGDLLIYTYHPAVHVQNSLDENHFSFIPAFSSLVISESRASKLT